MESQFFIENVLPLNITSTKIKNTNNKTLNIFHTNKFCTLENWLNDTIFNCVEFGQLTLCEILKAFVVKKNRFGKRTKWNLIASNDYKAFRITAENFHDNASIFTNNKEIENFYLNFVKISLYVNSSINSSIPVLV